MASDSETENSPLLLFPHDGITKATPIKVEDLQDPNEDEELLTNFDQVLAEIGEFGLWQQLMVGLLWLPSIGGGIIVLLWSFTGLEPRKFRCALPCDGPDAKFGDIQDGVYQTDDDFCSVPNLPLNLTEDFQNNNCSAIGWLDEFDMAKCDINGRLIYEDFEFHSTLVTELNLVCEDQYKVALVGTAYMVGLFIGSLLGSMPADKFGRKTMVFVFVVVAGVSNLIGGFLTEFWSYLVFRTFAGAGEMGCVMVTFTLSVELVGAKQQAYVGNMNQLVFAIGECISGGLAYLIRDWRTLHFVSTAFILPQLVMWWVIPESPRWLITEGKWTQLKKVLKTAEKLNKKKLPSTLIIPDENSNSLFERNFDEGEEVSENLGAKDMLTQKVLRWRSVIMALNWAIAAMIYYGIGMSMTVLGGDIFLNFVLAAVLEIAGYVVCILISDFWGRKPVIITNFLVCGLACIGSAFVPDSNPGKIVLVLLGKMGASGAFSTSFVYTAELFPTPIRGTAVGLCSTFGRIGSIAAPQLALYIPRLTFEELPLLIFGVAGVIGGVISFFLPETLGHPLPDTLLEAAQQGGPGSKKLCEWWGRKRLEEQVEKQRKFNEELKHGKRDISF